jgi:hypothetical protein
MAAEILNLNIEKGVDYSISMILQRSDGSYIDLSNTGICIKADIVEFYDCPPVTGFTIEEILPSGVKLSLNEQGTLALPYFTSYYDVVLNVDGATERLVMGEITPSPASTTNTSCP